MGAQELLGGLMNVQKANDVAYGGFTVDRL